MKNTLGDLHNILMERIEKLADDDLAGEELAEEITRCKAITGVAGTVIENAGLVLSAQKQAHEIGQMRGGEEWRPLLPGAKRNGA